MPFPIFIRQAEWCQGLEWWVTCKQGPKNWIRKDMQRKNQSTKAWDFSKSIFDHHIGLVFIETGTNMATSQYNFKMKTGKIAVWDSESHIQFLYSLVGETIVHLCIFEPLLPILSNIYSKLSEFTWDLLKMTSPSSDERSWIIIA